MASEKLTLLKGKGGKKAIRGKMPTKRSINLILVDENKVSVPKAILGIVLIVLLAGLFSKYMVYDRLVEMSRASGRAEQAKSDLNSAEALLDTFGDVESDYAHYTYEGMTAAELGLVDRISVLKLVRDMLPGGETILDPREFSARVQALVEPQVKHTEDALEPEEFWEQFWNLCKRVIPASYHVSSWSVSQNLLSVDISAGSLERLNKLARELEKNPIVDSCAITTANKQASNNSSDAVRAKLLVYLRQPPAEEG